MLVLTARLKRQQLFLIPEPAIATQRQKNWYGYRLRSKCAVSSVSTDCESPLHPSGSGLQPGRSGLKMHTRLNADERCQWKCGRGS